MVSITGAEIPTIQFMPIITIGLILGLYELILIHRDESFRGSHWFGHGLHCLVFMWIALFFIFNTDYFLELTGLGAKGWPIISSTWGVRILIGIILNIKMHGTSAVIKGGAFRGGLGGGMAEHWTHTIIVSALCVAAPLYWPIAAQFLPSWVPGAG